MKLNDGNATVVVWIFIEINHEVSWPINVHECNARYNISKKFHQKTVLSAWKLEQSTTILIFVMHTFVRENIETGKENHCKCA